MSGQKLAHRPTDWPIKIVCTGRAPSEFARKSRMSWPSRQKVWPDFWPSLPSTHRLIHAGGSEQVTVPQTFEENDGPGIKRGATGVVIALISGANPGGDVTMSENAANEMSTPMPEPRLGRSVSLDHAAEILGVSRRTIYNRIREGRLVTIRTLGGPHRVLLDSVN